MKKKQLWLKELIELYYEFERECSGGTFEEFINWLRAYLNDRGY